MCVRMCVASISHESNIVLGFEGNKHGTMPVL